jgi:diguanylate cyclase (GGDEF)-like protein
MTGLFNRASFNARLEAGLAALDGGARTAAIAFFDVDDFKAINDRHSHEAGDEFLKHVARTIGGVTTPADLAARVGGDEFTVAFADRDAAAIAEAVERVVLAVRQPITVQGRSVSGRISAGLYFIEAESGLADAMHKANVALYQAKIDGGNTHRLFSQDMETGMQARRALEQLIRDAVANEAFVLHYQPLLDVATRRCAGFEALLRLPDGQGGLVPPATFIPVAEAMGLINEIGKWVIERATRAASSWPDDMFVSVNLSVNQFHDGQLMANVRQALAASGLRPGQLELEVTESMLMENTAVVAAQLRALRELGVSIAMDDFGTGYSSLGYLWQFGFDKLKIDRSFVSGLDVPDSQARDILDTIIMLGHKLDMTVTAEGIETEHQAKVLEALACDHFQGYLYGRPAPEEAIAGFLLGNLQPNEGRSRRRAAGAA